jgi:signal transduction histidine kinase
MSQAKVLILSSLLTDREVNRLTVRIFRYRFLLIPLLAFILTAFAIWDPRPWKLYWIAGLLSFLIIVSVVEYQRAVNTQTGIRTIQVNLVFMILIQTGIFYITGGIESPLVVIYAPMCMAAGLLIAKKKTVLMIVAIPNLVILLFTLSSLYHLFPQTLPVFFSLEDHPADRSVYLWTSASVLILLNLITSTFSHTVRQILSQQMEERLTERAQFIESLAGRNKEIQSVARTVAHELKNPLASVQGLAQLLARSGQFNEKNAERLGVLNAEIQRMTKVLEGFQNFSRPMSSLHLEKVDVNKVVTAVANLHEAVLLQNDIDLSLAGQPVEIFCDAQKIKQALINLLLNAIEACGAGDSIALRCGPWKSDGVRIEIQDSGPGLTVEVEKHLFEPGFSTKTGGSGIGLVMARSVAVQHGGQLVLVNGTNRGSLAVLTLREQKQEG